MENQSAIVDPNDVGYRIDSTANAAMKLPFFFGETLMAKSFMLGLRANYRMKD
jgi:hypothetical protein